MRYFVRKEIIKMNLSILCGQVYSFLKIIIAAHVRNFEVMSDNFKASGIYASGSRGHI
jgi:hypothetical protein